MLFADGVPRLLGCAPTVSGPLQPLVVGAEEHLTIDWQLARSDQAIVVWCYVSNQSPYTFDRICLLVDALAQTVRSSARALGCNRGPFW